MQKVCFECARQRDAHIKKHSIDAAKRPQAVWWSVCIELLVLETATQVAIQVHLLVGMP